MTMIDSSWLMPPVSGVPRTISTDIVCPAWISSVSPAARNGPSVVNPIWWPKAGQKPSK